VLSFHTNHQGFSNAYHQAIHVKCAFSPTTRLQTYTRGGSLTKCVHRPGSNIHMRLAKRPFRKPATATRTIKYHGTTSDMRQGSWRSRMARPRDGPPLPSLCKAHSILLYEESIRKESKPRGSSADIAQPRWVPVHLLTVVARHPFPSSPW